MARTGFLLLALFTAQSSFAQQGEDPFESLLEQMEQMMQDFQIKGMPGLDSMDMGEFSFPNMDSIYAEGFKGFGGTMPGFFHMDSLQIDLGDLESLDFNLDMNSLLEEMTEGMDSLDNDYFMDLEGLMKQFLQEGIRPDNFEIPSENGKKKKRVYKI